METPTVGRVYLRDEAVGTDTREAKEKSLAQSDSVGLADKADEFPSRLSGGQKKRAVIAHALAMDSQLILFDKVTSALDPELVGEVLKTMW